MITTRLGMWAAMAAGIALPSLASAAAPRESAVSATVSVLGSPAPDRPGILAVDFQIADGWHIYWRNPGESGAPTRVEVEWPEGVVAGPMLWPTPTRHVAPGGIVDYVHSGATRLLIPFRTTRDLTPDDAANVKVAWFMCTDEVCVPGDATARAPLARDLDSPAQAAQEIATAFMTGRFPGTAAPGLINTNWDGPTLRFSVEKARRLEFFPDPASAEMPDMKNPHRDGAGEGDALSVEFAPAALEPGRVVTGVLAVTDIDGQRRGYDVRIPGPTPRNGTGAAPPPPGASGSDPNG